MIPKVKYYIQNLDQKIYRKLNKDKGVNYFFRSDKVGKCVKMFDDYYQSAEKVSASGWHDYYFKNSKIEPLRNATDYIVEKHGISIKEAKMYIYHRIIGQTWNGMQEEFNAIDQLREVYPNMDFQKAPYELDEKYFTDWQCFLKGKLLYGLQIKPFTYNIMSSPYQLKAKENHKEQRRQYKNDFKVAHFMVFYKDHKIEDLQNLCNMIDTYSALNINVK